MTTGAENGARITCSVGVMAYNEEANIQKLLERLSTQKTEKVHLREIVVVASGCTDGTEEIVRAFSSSDARVNLVVQASREGKASAINEYLARSEAEVHVLISGDTLPEVEAIERLVLPFQDPTVGMTGGRPVPIQKPDHFVPFVVNLEWVIHHRIAMEHPKLGEMVAFRRVLNEIPSDTAVDEACIEALILAKGLRLVYVPDSVVRNKGPETVKDFLKQRRRIAAGHAHLAKTQGYTVSTTSPLRILRYVLAETCWSRPREWFWTFGAIALEGWGRILGIYDLYIRKQNPFNWDIATSTKDLDR